MLVGSVIALVEGVSWALWVAISAASVLFGLALLGALFEGRKREVALDLIIDGRERLPIAAVQRQRRRLLALRTRNTLARSFERLLREASDPTPAIRVKLFDAQTVTAVADDLHALIRLLRADDAPPRGVALAQRLLTDGTSPLYGREVEPLREQLQRIRHLLSA